MLSELAIARVVTVFEIVVALFRLCENGNTVILPTLCEEPPYWLAAVSKSWMTIP